MTNGNQPGVDELHRISKTETSRKFEAFANTLCLAWLSVVLSGPAFGICWVLAILVSERASPHEVLLPASLAVVVGALFATISSTFAIVVVLVFNRSMGGLLSHRLGVLMFGGLSGFAAAEPVLGDVAGVVFGGSWLGDHPAIGVIGAMVFGQTGALLWLWKVSGVTVDYKPRSVRHSGLQFGIQHLMVLMFWFALIFGIDQAVEGHLVIEVVGFYVVAQSVLLLIDWGIGYLHRHPVVLNSHE